MSSHVLLVEDDEDVRRAIEEVLRAAGFEVRSATDGQAALRSLFEHSTDLVVIDLGLPGMDGLTLIGRVRDLSDLPVLVLSARSRESDKVRGLGAGADDYLTKPFGKDELVARVRALLRRAGEGRRADGYADGALRIDYRTRQVWVDSREVHLSVTEWQLLTALVAHPNQVLTAEQLLVLAWKDPLGVGPERVKFAVLRLRRKLGWIHHAASPIEAVRGFGYRYRPS